MMYGKKIHFQYELHESTDTQEKRKVENRCGMKTTTIRTEREQ